MPSISYSLHAAHGNSVAFVGTRVGRPIPHARALDGHEQGRADATHGVSYKMDNRCVSRRFCFRRRYWVDIFHTGSMYGGMFPIVPGFIYYLTSSLHSRERISMSFAPLFFEILMFSSPDIWDYSRLHHRHGAPSIHSTPSSSRARCCRRAQPSSTPF